jgi:hypothetical protein
MADDKQADPATRLEVDVMMLEYLVYSATKALLEVRKGEGSRKKPPSIGAQSDLLITLVDCMKDPPKPPSTYKIADMGTYSFPRNVRHQSSGLSGSR